MNKIIKHIMITFGIGILGCFVANSFVSAQGFQAGSVSGYHVIGTDNHDDDPNSEPRLLTTVKNTINRVLGILGLITLILCLRGGFQMLTAAGDDGKVKTGKKILTQAAIGLAVIGLSWLFVSFIFRLINRTQQP